MSLFNEQRAQSLPQVQHILSHRVTKKMNEDAVSYSHIELLIKWDNSEETTWVPLFRIYPQIDNQIRRYFRQHNL